MCNRVSNDAADRDMVARFQVELIDGTWSPSYNIGPYQPIPAVWMDGINRRLNIATFGLWPAWCGDTRPKHLMTNARAETILERPAYKTAFTKRRCLIPATGYYEWKTEGRDKQPYYFRMAGDKRLLAFAGIYEDWQRGDGQAMRSCAIITTTPNEQAGRVHDRMPVILRPEEEAHWLDARAATGDLLPSLAPFPNDLMRSYPVDKRVGKIGFEDAFCSVPLEWN